MELDCENEVGQGYCVIHADNDLCAGSATLANSCVAFSGSGRCIIASIQVTMSKLSSSYGRFSASP